MICKGGLAASRQKPDRGRYALRTAVAVTYKTGLVGSRRNPDAGSHASLMSFLFAALFFVAQSSSVIWPAQRLASLLRLSTLLCM